VLLDQPTYIIVGKSQPNHTGYKACSYSHWAVITLSCSIDIFRRYVNTILTMGIIIWTITEGVSIFHNDGDVYMYPNDKDKRYTSICQLQYNDNI